MSADPHDPSSPSSIDPIAPTGVGPAMPRLGRYTDLRLLGEGGMGAVFRGRDPSLDREVAIKVMKDKTPDFLSRFRREAKVMAKLSHPNVVQVFDFGEDADGNPFFVMELVEGRSLQRIMEEQGPLQPAYVVDMLKQAAEGLAAAHAAGIVHRDIKPDNMVVTSTGLLKLVDFGIARVDTGGGEGALTKPQSLLGTPLYMAPEMLSGKPVDGRADIYALGLTAYHLLVGKPPFAAPSALELMMKQLNAPLPDLASEAPRTPPALVELIRRMSEKDREKRVPSCADLARELGELRLTGGSTTMMGPVPVGAGRMRMIGGVLGGILALTIGAIVYVVLTKRPHEVADNGNNGNNNVIKDPGSDPNNREKPKDDKAKVATDSPLPGDSTPPPAGDKPAPLGKKGGALRVAVMQWKNFGGEKDLAFLTEGIGDTVLTALGQAQGRIRLIERNQLEQAQKEVDFGQTKYADKTSAVKLGKMTGAEVAVIGGYQRAEGQIRVTARFVRTDTGDVLDTMQVTRPAKQIFDVQDEVARELKTRLLALVGK